MIATRGKDRPYRGPELDELLANCLIIQDGATVAVVRIGGPALDNLVFVTPRPARRARRLCTCI